VTKVGTVITLSDEVNIMESTTNITEAWYPLLFLTKDNTYSMKTIRNMGYVANIYRNENMSLEKIRLETIDEIIAI
jgi:hypothetical protein